MLKYNFLWFFMEEGGAHKDKSATACGCQNVALLAVMRQIIKNNTLLLAEAEDPTEGSEKEGPETWEES